MSPFHTSRQLRSDKPTIHYQLVQHRRASSAPATVRAIKSKLVLASPTSPLPPAVPLHFEIDISSPSVEHIVAAFDNSDDDMAESNFGPVLFTGANDQDARTWLNTLCDYIAYKGVAADKMLALFKLRLSGHARDWLVTVPDDQKDSFEHLSTAFLARFQPKELEKYKYAKDLFEVRQEKGESVDEYITKLRKKAGLVGLDSKIQIFAALNGLLPAIASYVMEHNPTTLDEILQHARVAEITRNPSAKSDDRVSSQLDKITEELTRLSARMSIMTTAAVTARPQSVSPGRRQVNFQDQRPRSPSPYRRPEAAYRTEQRPPSVNYRQSRPEFSDRPAQQYEPRSSFQLRPAQDNYPRQFPRPTPVSVSNDNGPLASCTRCGRLGGHTNPQYCPMLTRDCFTCGLRGHAARMCAVSQPSKQY